MHSPKVHSTMRAAGHGRTIFAGFGAAGSLLAAIGATFVVAGGVLGFQQWPSELAPAPDKDLAVAAAAIPRAPVSLPAARRAPRTARPATGVNPSGAVRRAGTRFAGRGTTTGPARPAQTPSNSPTQSGSQPGKSVVPSTPPVLPGVSALVPPVDQTAVATGVESTSSATAKTLQSVGEALPVAQPVTDLLGGVVDGAGRALGGLLRGLSG